MNQKRGYVPGSYLVVHPTGKPAQQSSAPSASSDTKPHASSTPSTSSDTKAHASSQAQCAKCATSNPRVARFCRKCGNHLQNWKVDETIVFFCYKISIRRRLSKTNRFSRCSDFSHYLCLRMSRHFNFLSFFETSQRARIGRCGLKSQ